MIFVLLLKLLGLLFDVLITTSLLWYFKGVFKNFLSFNQIVRCVYYSVCSCLFSLLLLSFNILKGVFMIFLFLNQIVWCFIWCSHYCFSPLIFWKWCSWLFLFFNQIVKCAIWFAHYCLSHLLFERCVHDFFFSLIKI